MGEAMYSKEEFFKDCLAVFHQTTGKTVVIPGTGNVVLFDEPLTGFAAADDDLFKSFKNPEIIGANYLTPTEWLPSAKTVVSFFLPFSEKVRTSNRSDKDDPSPEWLYGRIEGQEYITRFMDGLRNLMEGKEIESIVPSSDPRFGMQIEMRSSDGIDDFHVDSRWSERHAAYVCGLGTFGLSRGLITEKGMAGRFASLIVSEEFEATERPYTGIDDYCVRCGACARNCPVHAISLEHGKNNILCKAKLDEMKVKYSPRYGCGKCQVGVPCEFRAPGRKGGKSNPCRKKL